MILVVQTSTALPENPLVDDLRTSVAFHVVFTPKNVTTSIEKL